MNPAAEYKKAAKSLNELDVSLSKALDRLDAAHAAKNPDEVSKARVAAEKLEDEVETALHEVHRAHRQYWIARASEIRREALEQMSALRRYRQALKPSGQGSALAMSLAYEILEQPDGPVPDDLGEIPYEPERARALDRAEKQTW